MSSIRKVAVVVGSLRKGSLNQVDRPCADRTGAAGTFAGNRPKLAACRFTNQDLDDAPPEAWVAFREQDQGRRRRAVRVARA